MVNCPSPLPEGNCICRITHLGKDSKPGREKKGAWGSSRNCCSGPRVRGTDPYCEIANSILRLRNLPSSESLEAMGLVSPKPLVIKLVALTPCPTR